MVGRRGDASDEAGAEVESSGIAKGNVVWCGLVKVWE